MPLPYGAGSAPAGWSPAATYNPVPVRSPYVVYQDPKSGLADTGRLIDTGTKQFVYTAAGDTQGMGTVPQLVLIAWGTLNPLANVKTFAAGWENQVASLYTNAAAYLISKKLMSIESFTMVRFGINSLKITIAWKDLTTGLTHPYSPPS